VRPGTPLDTRRFPPHPSPQPIRLTSMIGLDNPRNRLWMQSLLHVLLV
jgi:hypothetical protein